MGACLRCSRVPLPDHKGDSIYSSINDDKLGWDWKTDKSSSLPISGFRVSIIAGRKVKSLFLSKSDSEKEGLRDPSLLLLLTPAISNNFKMRVYQENFYVLNVSS